MPNNENQLPATLSPDLEADKNQLLLPLDVARVVTSFMTRKNLLHIYSIEALSDTNYQEILHLNHRTNLVTAMLLEERKGTTPSDIYIKYNIDEMNVIKKEIEEIEQKVLFSYLRIALCCPNAAIQIPTLNLVSVILFIVSFLLLGIAEASRPMCSCSEKLYSFVLDDLFCYERNVYYHYKFKGEPWEREICGDQETPPPPYTHPQSCPALFFAPVAQICIGCDQLHESNPSLEKLQNRQKAYSKSVERYYSLMAPSSCGMV